MPKKLNDEPSQIQIDRLNDILARLRNKQVINLPELAKEFNVTWKTVKRDLDCLEKRGLRIEKVGASLWRLAGSFTGGPLVLEPGDRRDPRWAMIAQTAKNLGASADGSFRFLYEGIVGNNPGKSESDIVPVMPKRKDTEKLTGLINALQDAIQEHLKINFIYAKDNKPRTSRPIRLFITEGAIYLFAIPDDRPGITRCYRLNKIRKLVKTHKTFSCPPEIRTLLKNKRSIWAITADASKAIPVKLKVENHAVEYYQNLELVAGQKVKAGKNGSLLFTAEVKSFNEIIPHILRWMPDVSVVSPPELKEEIASRISKYLKK